MTPHTILIVEDDIRECEFINWIHSAVLGEY